MSSVGQVKRNGEVMPRVKKLVNKEHAWFWNERWQDGEREAEEDIRAGRVYRFDTIDEAIVYLHKRVKGL